MKKAIETARSAFGLFKSFVTFCGNKYAQILFAIMTLVLLSALFLSSYYLFAKIKQIELQVSPPTDRQRQADLVATTENNKKIDQILTNLLAQKNADRAYLFKLHDSVKSIKGQHFYFATNTNEMVAKGIAPEAANLQNVPVSNINDVMEELVNNRCYEKNVCDISDTSERIEFERQGIKTLKVCPVYDLDGTVLLGFVGVDWVKQPAQSDDLIPKGYITQAANKISAIIDN